MNVKDISIYINNIKILIENNIPQSKGVLMKKINVILIKITSLFDSLLKEKELVIKYENMLQKNENNIRQLYKKIFHLQLTIGYQENTITSLVTKEKEYEKLKEKTGAYYVNGKLIYNERKDNEIMILRTENSNLKSFIENKENDIKSKDNEIIKLKEQLLILNKKRKNNGKKANKNNSLPNLGDLKYTYSNININFNEIANPNSIKKLNSSSKTKNKSNIGIIDKAIYIPPQLRNDLSVKEIFKKKNIDNYKIDKKYKKKIFLDNNEKINQSSNEDKYISVNKSNYNILTNKRHERLMSNTINQEINLGKYSWNKSPIKGRKTSEIVINFQSHNDKDSNHNESDLIIKRIMNKLQFNKKIKKLPFYSSYVSPMNRYSNHNFNKKKLFLK